MEFINSKRVIEKHSTDSVGLIEKAGNTFTERAKTRETNIELLRIISMLMIITTHFLSYGGIWDKGLPMSSNYFLVWTIEAICYVAVNCYVLISGYFLINSSFKIKRLIKLWAQVFFYSLGIYLILCFFGLVSFDIKSLMYSIIPISSKRYWFVTIYIAMYILSPFLNIAIKSMTKNQLQCCIVLMIVMFSIWPTIIFFCDAFSVERGYSLTWFLCLYFSAAYIRLYYKPNGKKLFWAVGYFLLSIMVAGIKFFITFVTMRLFGQAIGSSILYQYNSIVVFMASLCLFVLFLNVNIRNQFINKMILFFSGTTFGVYLIHTNNHFRDILWNNIVKPFDYLNSAFLILHLIYYVLIIFIFCSVIEYFRKKIFYKIDNTIFLKRYWSKLEAYKPWDSICMFIFRERQ